MIKSEKVYIRLPILLIMPKKKRIGYIFSEKKLGKDEKIFLKIAKRKNIELIMINVSKDIDEADFEEKIKKCDLIFNSTAEDFALEYAKVAENLGKKVIDSPYAFYYTEDKWEFFVKCKKNRILTPETKLLSENIGFAKKELKKFGHWPVILKRIDGTMGEYVELAKDLNHAAYIMNKFWKKGSERLPIIAQELIHSPSYRVLVIGGKIVQTALKENKSSWKATGVYAHHFKKFKIDKELKKIINKIIKMVKINICGIDLLKKDGKWIALEVNSEPAFDFFENETERMIGLTLDFLKKQIR